MTPVHVLMFLPAIVVGILGGILGATFSMLNVRIVKQRAKLVNFVKRPAAKKFLRMLEPVIIMVSAVFYWKVNTRFDERLRTFCNYYMAQNCGMWRCSPASDSTRSISGAFDTFCKFPSPLTSPTRRFASVPLSLCLLYTSPSPRD